MTAIQHILLPIDGSEESLRVFAPIAALAPRFHARVTLLNVAADPVHITNPSGSGLPMPQASEQVAAAARRQLLELRGRLPADLDVQTDVVVRFDIGVAIVDYARKQRVDLIAMATHGRSGLRRMILGSVAESVLRQATVPMLIYPPASPPE